MRKGRFSLRLITACAMMTALSVVLNRFCSIHTWGWTIGFAFVPVALAAIVYGPAAGAVVGALADLIGALLFPFGPYHPGFTVVGALMGAVYGIFLFEGVAAILCASAVFACAGLGFLFFGISFLWARYDQRRSTGRGNGDVISGQRADLAGCRGGDDQRGRPHARGTLVAGRRHRCLHLRCAAGDRACEKKIENRTAARQVMAGSARV